MKPEKPEQKPDNIISEIVFDPSLRNMNNLKVSGNNRKDGLEIIPSLSKVNIFVGENNSGKSRLIRGLLGDKDFSFNLRRVNNVKKNFEKSITEFKKKINAQSRIFHGSIMGRYYQKILDYGIPEFLNQKYNIHEELISPLHNILHSGNNDVELRGNRDYINFSTSIEIIIEDFEPLIPKEPIPNFDKIYIPILRGLRAIGNKKTESEFHFNTEQDNYRRRTQKDYFLFNGDDKFMVDEDSIFTGLGLFNDLKAHLLGSHEKREKARKFEDFLKRSFFNGAKVELVPMVEDDVVHIKIGEGNEFPIHQLGDGIQSIIILTYPIFFSEAENLLVFIEEPELHLHPGMQRILLETYLNEPEFQKCQFFLTTHSNHFLDMTLDFEDISIYTVKKNGKTEECLIENVKSPDNNTLELLGVRNSSVYLTNCTIWVEGITDRIYIRRFLELIQEQEKEKTNFKEDIHYSFVEYGGNNITHWSFLEEDESNPTNIDVETLCGKLFLISDRDKNKEERHEKLKKALKKRFYLLECLEIENILPKETLIMTVEGICKKKGPNFSVNKFEYADYKNMKLGEFIDQNFKDRGKTFKGKSGSINSAYKLDFANEAVKHLGKLSGESEKLAKELLAFIKENNV